MKALSTYNIRIPEDVKIVGFDDTPTCEYLTPSPTSVAIDKQQLGKEAVEGLVSIVRNEFFDKTNKLRIKAELRKRQKCLYHADLEQNRDETKVKLLTESF